MELPKTVLQIGIPDKVHKIYVEDYVVSYIKQLGKYNRGKNIGLALYGKQICENEQHYYFLYGAAAVEGLAFRDAYLSQVEKDEVETIGKRYFEQYTFLAWCTLKEEPVDSFYIMVQGKGIEVQGYACFYEKNESMLNYMLIHGNKKTDETEIYSSESVKERREDRNWEAYQQKRQENISGHTVQEGFNTEKRSRIEKPSVKKKLPIRVLKTAAAAAFLCLCVLGITVMNDYEKIEELQAAARQVITSLAEKKLPDPVPTETEGTDNELPSKDTALEKIVSGKDGNEIAVTDIPAQETAPADSSTQETLTDDNSTQETAPSDTPIQEVSPSDTSTQTDPPLEPTLPNIPEQSDIISENSSVNSHDVATMYTIQEGDTLTSICMTHYGSIDNIQRICNMNQITDADTIKIGQIILLP